MMGLGSLERLQICITEQQRAPLPSGCSRQAQKWLRAVCVRGLGSLERPLKHSMGQQRASQANR